MKTTGPIALAPSSPAAHYLADAIAERFPFADLSVEPCGRGWSVTVHGAACDLWSAINKHGADLMILAYSHGAT